MVRPWNEWMVIWGYDINGPAPEVDEVEAAKIVYNLIGDADVPVKIEDISLWTNNAAYMTGYSQGRVYCMGDACHRHPPNNGLGSNTSIQDAYNLAWKLALVLRGNAAESLLDSYDQERAPVGRQVVERANRSITEFGAIFEALGLLEEDLDADALLANMDARQDDTPAGARRRAALRAAMELKNYEFNAHGVELNRRYESQAVVSEGTAEPAYERDRELYYQATTWPGARLPHCWVEHDGQTKSTLDLAGQGRFALLTGIGGEAWESAAREVAERTGVKIATYVIGPGRPVRDLYGDWARLSEVSDGGCVLVRPDQYVGWRRATVADDCAGELGLALDQILGDTRAEVPAPANPVPVSLDALIQLGTVASLPVQARCRWIPRDRS